MKYIGQAESCPCRLLQLLILPVVGLSSVLTAAEVARPNIIWITAEDMSPQLGCYGDDYAITPRIDTLAKNSIRYTACFADAPVCAPSRSGIITGMQCGPLGTSQMRSEHRIPQEVRPFPAYLRAAGYYCGNNLKTDYNMEGANRRIKNDAWDLSSGDAHWRKRAEGQPFFLVFNYMDTHQSRASRQTYEWFQEQVQSRLKPEEIHDPAKAPLPPFYPETKTARRTIARYYDCITTLDHFVGKILGELKEDGLAEDTIVFFYSDHGAGIPGGKGTAFEFGMRVPMLVHFPEKFRHLAPAAQGSIIDHPVSFADLGPTVLHLAGVDLPAYVHGRPFLGKNLPEPRRYAFGIRDRHDETLETTRWINDGRYHLMRSYRTNVPADQQTLISRYNALGELCQEIRTLKAEGGLSPIQQRFWGESRPRVMLFDTKRDPWCLKNLADDPAHRDVRERMLSALNEYLLENRDLGFWPEPDLAEAEKNAPAYTLARTTNRYPLERVLETADLTDPRKLTVRLSDQHPHVRYWAAVTLLGFEKPPLGALPKMTMLLDDPSASVRIEVAPFVVTHGKPADANRALDLLARELESPNEWAACRAARALELLGERAQPKIDAMRAALEARKTDLNYGFEFSLTSALERLGHPPAPGRAATRPN
jgi:N-sulfoglucosamine sulfohydrolase